VFGCGEAVGRENHRETQRFFYKSGVTDRRSLRRRIRINPNTATATTPVGRVTPDSKTMAPLTPVMRKMKCCNDMKDEGQASDRPDSPQNLPPLLAMTSGQHHRHHNRIAS